MAARSDLPGNVIASIETSLKSFLLEKAFSSEIKDEAEEGITTQLQLELISLLASLATESGALFSLDTASLLWSQLTGYYHVTLGCDVDALQQSYVLKCLNVIKWLAKSHIDSISRDAKYLSEWVGLSLRLVDLCQMGQINKETGSVEAYFADVYRAGVSVLSIITQKKICVQTLVDLNEWNWLADLLSSDDEILRHDSLLILRNVLLLENSYQLSSVHELAKRSLQVLNPHPTVLSILDVVCGLESANGPNSVEYVVNLENHGFFGHVDRLLIAAHSNVLLSHELSRILYKTAYADTKLFLNKVDGQSVWSWLLHSLDDYQLVPNYSPQVTELDLFVAHNRKNMFSDDIYSHRSIAVGIMRLLITTEQGREFAKKKEAKNAIAKLLEDVVEFDNNRLIESQVECGQNVLLYLVEAYLRYGSGGFDANAIFYSLVVAYDLLSSRNSTYIMAASVFIDSVLKSQIIDLDACFLRQLGEKTVAALIAESLMNSFEAGPEKVSGMSGHLVSCMLLRFDVVKNLFAGSKGYSEYFDTHLKFSVPKEDDRRVQVDCRGWSFIKT